MKILKEPLYNNEKILRLLFTKITLSSPDHEDFKYLSKKPFLKNYRFSSNDVGQRQGKMFFQTIKWSFKPPANFKADSFEIQPAGPD